MATPSHTRRLVLATRNRGKLAELAALLADLPLVLLGLDELPAQPEVEETGETFEENALLKARAACQRSGLPAVADDSGLCVDALDGAPGVRSARFAGPGATDTGNNRLLLERLTGVPDERRGARFVCAAAIVLPGGRETVVTGEVEGRIVAAPRGHGGFGYDPLFFYPPFACTFGEADPEEKNRVSHRGRAFRALAVVIRAGLGETTAS